MHISIRQAVPDDAPTIARLNAAFDDLRATPEHIARISVTEARSRGDEQAIVQQAMGSTAGFTLVLAGLKALLEHNIMLNLVADRFPGESDSP